MVGLICSSSEEELDKEVLEVSSLSDSESNFRSVSVSPPNGGLVLRWSTLGGSIVIIVNLLML